MKNKLESWKPNIKGEVSTIRTHKYRDTPSTIDPNMSFENISFVDRTKLAPILSPSYDGNIQNRASLYDVFQAKVHDDDTLLDA